MNRNDVKMFAPTLAAASKAGPLADIETLHLDRGYDSDGIPQSCKERALADGVIVREAKRGKKKAPAPAAKPRDTAE